MLNKICYIIAGPNGAGKTTAALDFLLNDVNCSHFLNADEISSRLILENSQELPQEIADRKSARILINATKQFVKKEVTFAVETTLSGLTYKKNIVAWQKLGYKVILYFFRLPTVEIAISRVKSRVLKGGHNIPEQDIRRRYESGMENFDKVYKNIVDYWVMYDASGTTPQEIGHKNNDTK